MSEFTCEIIETNNKLNNLSFEIRGNNEYGFDKSIINSIRRILLSRIPSVAFVTNREMSDLKVIKNNTSLHNEFLLHRISLIPLYIDPEVFNKGLLFHLKVENKSNQLRPITAKDFNIYKVKPSIIEECRKKNDYSILDVISFDNYDISDIGKLTDEEKENIFRPFKYKINGKEMVDYCLITELGATTSKDNIQEIDIYGSPTSSNCQDKNVCWQAVSCATYSFKEDEDLFVRAAKNKITINNISDENQEKFVKELQLSEGERYFHRDKQLQPYWYNFKVDSQSYYSSKELLIKSCEILIKIFERVKLELKKSLDPESKSLFKIKQCEGTNDFVYKLLMDGGDDTIGSIMQSHISNKYINDESALGLVGYKKVHPLEDKITFTISISQTNAIIKLNNSQKINSIIDIFINCCDDLNIIYEKVKTEFEKL